MKFKEHTAYALVVTAYISAIVIVTLAMVLKYSQWWAFLLVGLFFLHAKYTSHAKCPKCGHEFDLDIEADERTSSS